MATMADQGIALEKHTANLKTASETGSSHDSDILNGEWTAEEERRIVRQLDLKLVPVVTVLYLLCFIDRANIGNARIMGMQEELKLGGMKFNWALTIFYIPYLL